MLRVRTQYLAKPCEYGNYREIRTDLSGCNLLCHFCWSPASRPDHESVLVSVAEVSTATIAWLKKDQTFIRFTGGEPTLQWSAVRDCLRNLQGATDSFKPPVLIQTNGIEIGKGKIDLSILTADPDSFYLFELSFKGTNEEEFALLTGKASDLYQYQVQGYQRLCELSRVARNVSVIAVLGVYHSATQRDAKYAFVNPQSKKLLFDDPTLWQPAFSSLWRTARLKWVEPLRMSPMGVWKNVQRRCGPDRAKILAHFPSGISVNQHGLFPAKPKSADYARQIVTRRFW